MADDDNVRILRPGGGGSPPDLPPLPGGLPPGLPTAPPPSSGGGANPFPGPAGVDPAGPGVIPVPPPRLPDPVPAGLRSEPPPGVDEPGPHTGLGTLGLAASLAVALAAMRGTAGVLQDWRQRRMERAAEAEPLRKAKARLELARLGTDAGIAGMSGRRAPSSHDWGRQAGGRSGGGGGGRTGRTGSGLFGSGGGSGGRGSSGTGSGRTAPAGSPSGHRSTGLSGLGSSSRSGGAGAPGRASGQPAQQGSGVLDRIAAAAKSGLTPKGQGGKGKSADKPPKGQGADGRTTLRKAMGDDISGRAAARLAHRRGALGTPPVSLLKGATKAAKDSKEKKDSKDAKKPKPERVSLRKAASEDIGSRAEERLKARREHPGPPFVGRDPKAEEREARREKKKREEKTGRPDEGLAGTGAAGEGPGDSPGPGSPGPGPGSGRGPGDIPDPYTVTVTREGPDRSPKGPSTPAGIAPGVQGLPRAPHRTPHTRPGTTAPTTTRGGIRMTKETSGMTRPVVRLPGGSARQMAAEHETEVTLDGVLDRLTESKEKCLSTYDECAHLARKAVELRDALEQLSDDLAERHNIIGRLTSAAMALMAESMDLVAAQAQAMRSKSLVAAEELESAHDEMHDAYRPVQLATADAGLATPSARAHNED